MVSGQVVVTFDHDQALVLSDWLDRLIGTERFDVLVDEDPAVWAPMYLLAGTLETALPDIFAPDYRDRLDTARRRLTALSPPAPRRGRLQVTVARAVPEPTTVPATVQVAGWVYEQEVVRLLRHLAHYVGYVYDALDEQALVGALDGTDDEDDHRWFDYPLHGSPVLTVRLARSLGSAVVTARIEGHIDAILAARAETLIDMLSSP